MVPGNDVQISKVVPSNDVQITKVVPAKKRSDDDDDLRFLKKVPAHPRLRLRRNLRNQNRLNDNDVEITKVRPSHPRDRLQRITKNRSDVQITKVRPSHPRDRLQRLTKNRSAKISLDKNVLKDLPYFNTQIKVNEADKNRRKEAIFDKVIKQLPQNNDQYYIKHDKKNDSLQYKRKNGEVSNVN